MGTVKIPTVLDIQKKLYLKSKKNVIFNRINLVKKNYIPPTEIITNTLIKS